MKYTKMLLALFVCFALSCSSENDFVEPKPTSGGGGGSASLTLQTVQLSTLQSYTNTSINSLVSSPSSYVYVEGGTEILQLRNVTGSPSFGFMNGIKVHKPTISGGRSRAEVRAQVVTALDKFQTGDSQGSSGASFKSNLLSSYDYIGTLNTQTFAQFEAYFENKLQNISFPPLGISKLSEKEKFALTQVYYTLLTIVRRYRPDVAPSVSCSPATPQQWMAIAEAAFDAGIMTGGTMGFWWAAAGTRATPTNPWVGGVVGGIAGFVTGFVGGATAGASAKFLWFCLLNTYGNTKPGCQVIQVCNQSTLYQYASIEAVPSGCNLQLQPQIDLRSITTVPLVPNKGRTTMATSVTNDLNWLLGYL